ncbi:MAG: cyclic nucleotide-binding domain-containing protein [Ignavibacteriaceae bacterium]
MEDKNEDIVHSSFWSNIFNAPTEKSDLEKTLRAIPIFKELNKKDLSLISKLINNRSYIAGEYIFYQGDPGLGLYLIRSGEVTIKQIHSDGEGLQLATLFKGDFFGELALIDGEKRSASAIAKTDTKVAVIFKPDLDEFIEKYPQKGIKILKGVLQIITYRLRKINDDFLSIQEQQKLKSED